MFFAHDEALPADTTSDLEHALTNDYVLLLGLLLLVGVIWTRFGKWRLITLMAVLLIATIGLYRVSPLSSGVALTLGFGLALFTMLSQGKRPNKT